MTQMQDNICKIRDLIANKEYDKLVHHKHLLKRLFQELHRHMRRKADDYNYELEFTSQDLRELAADIRGMMKSWDTAMNPEKNIKALAKKVTEDGHLNFDEFTLSRTKYLFYRSNIGVELLELLNLLEYHGVFLYFLEIVSNDEFAIKYTERLV